MEKRKFQSLEKAEEILKEEEKEVKEEIAKIEENIRNLQKKVEEINRESENWTKKLESGTLSAEELSEIYRYADQLSRKAKELLERIAEAEEEKKKLTEVLSEKVKMGISINSIKKRVKEKLDSEERARETRELDEYTRMRRWFTVFFIVLFFPASSLFAQSTTLEKKLFSTPPELVKVLKKREKELHKEEAKIELKRKFVQTLKDDVSFLLNILGEKVKEKEQEQYGERGGKAKRAPFTSNEEIEKVYKIINRLPPDEGGQILSKVKPQIVAFLLLHLNSMQAASLLSNMDVNQAARVVEILYSVAPERARSIFNLMGSSAREELKPKGM